MAQTKQAFGDDRNTITMGAQQASCCFSVALSDIGHTGSCLLREHVCAVENIAIAFSPAI